MTTRSARDVHHRPVGCGYGSRTRRLEGIRIATADGAYFHGLANELGSISAGKLADVVILNSDPLADIGNTLDEVWPRHRRYAPFQ